MTPRSLVLLSLWLTTGCATNLSLLSTANVLDPGHVRVTAGSGVYLPATQIVTAIATGTAVAADVATDAAHGEKPKLTEAHEQQLMTTAVALAVLPPALMVQLEGRVGVVKNLELGLAYRGSAVRGDAKYRLLHSTDEANPLASTDLALDLGVSKYLFSGPVFTVLDLLQLDHFSRWDVDASLIVSRDFNRYFSLYGAARYSWSRTTMDQTVVRISEMGSELTRTELTFPSQLDMHFIGATGGLRAGIQYISLVLELTAGYTVANGDILGAKRSLGGVTIYPAIGLTAAF